MTTQPAPTTELSEIGPLLAERLGAEWLDVPVHLRDIQVLLALGSLRAVSVAGLALFDAKPTWEAIGIEPKGNLASTLKAPPVWRLIGPGWAENFKQLAGSARRLLPRYGPYLEWLGGYYVPARIEPRLLREFTVLEDGWRRQVNQLADRHDELLAECERLSRRAAADAYTKLSSTAAKSLLRQPFVEGLVGWARSTFPSAETIQATLRIELRHVLPQGAHPSERVVQEVLGLREEIAARKALTEAQTQATREELEAARAMQARRMAEFEKVLEAETSPIAEAIAWAREQLAGSLLSAIDHLQSGKKLSARVLKALDDRLEVWRLTQQGEGEDAIAKVEAVRAELNRLRAGKLGRRGNRTARLSQALDDLQVTFGLEHAQAQAESRRSEQMALADWDDEPSTMIEIQQFQEA
jgi:hypothetical protein